MGKAKRIKDESVKDKRTDDKLPSDQEREVANGKRMKRLEDLPGLGPKTAQKLRDLGYSFVGLATGRADAISAEMGPSVSYSKAVAWVKAAQEAVMGMLTLKTGSQVAEERKKKIQYIYTNSKVFNDLIGGGIHTGQTTGISGRFATGKTQICFDALVDCIGRLGRKATYIETEPNTFSDKRIEEIAYHRKLEVDLDNIFVCEASQIPTAKAQYLQYKLILKELQRGTDIGLICVDSFTAKFRSGYSRREMLPVRTREFAEHFLIIDYIAAKYNVAWLLTCQVIGAPDPGQTLGIKMMTGDGMYPVGGNLMLHSMTTWISLQQVKTQLWKAVLYDSSYLPRGNCEFMITKKGIQDGIR